MREETANKRGYLFLIIAMAFLVGSKRIVILSAFQLDRHHQHIRWSRTIVRMSSSSNSNNNIISSTKSTTVKNIQALLTKRKRRVETQSTIVEGPRMIFDTLGNSKIRPLIKQVLVSTERQDWITQLQQYQQEHPFLIQQGTPQVLKFCSDTVTPQGIVAIVSIPEFDIISSQQQHDYPLYLILDGVSDPGNVGTLLRSSVAVGVSGVVLLPACCDVWNPKALRSSMGCTFQLPIRNVESWKETIELLGEWGVASSNIYAATMETSGSSNESIPHYDVEWTKRPSALVIGSEGNGLSDVVLKSVMDGTIRAAHVPMEAGIESLNAAVAGSVVLFEYQRQCRTVGNTVSLQSS